MGARHPVGEVEIAAVLPVVKKPVVERVENELAGDADQVDGACAILGDERAGCREVLAVHDLGFFDGAVVGGSVLLRNAHERGVEIGRPRRLVARLLELVDVGRWRDAIADD